MNCFVTEGGGRCCWCCWGWEGKNHILAWYLDPVHLIWTKFGMDILLDPRNKPVKEFFIFLKIQDRRRRSKICDALYFFNVFAITWIRFIGSRQNLTWTFYLTLGTSLRKNFSFFSKSKMATGSSFGSGSSDLDQIWQVDTTQPKEQAYRRISDLSQNPRWPPPPLRQITKSFIT